jgi:broad specificity phosphatase PhoE
MSSILESVEWGKPALTVNAMCSRLVQDLPAVMHIRHSERPTNLGIQVSITETGERAAYEFGSNLTDGRTYRIYHSYVDRSRETAEQIHRGIIDKGGDGRIMDLVDLSFVYDADKFMHYIIHDTQEHDVLKKGQSVFFKWVSGRYPNWELRPSLQFAQHGAAIMMKNLRSAGPDTLDIYVSHDAWVYAFLLHWSGITPLELIEFLDGFLLQLDDEKMIVYYRDKTIEVAYPYWWELLR